MKKTGNKIVLKPAGLSDREKIFKWLTQSDITPSVMGPPEYPDHAIPTWEDFCQDYTPAYFSASGDGKGRNYIIMANNQQVGTIGYDLLDTDRDRVVLDIWMRSEKYCGYGYGSHALEQLCHVIHKKYGITHFIISPSARNKRAVAAYRKAGFEVVKSLTKEEQGMEFGVAEYDDNVLMLKRIITKKS